MLARLRRLPAAAYGSLGLTLLGGLFELPLHFGRADWLPVYAGWLAGLSAIDRDFFYVTYELITHIFIGLGLTGMIVTVLYFYIRESDQETTAPR